MTGGFSVKIDWPQVVADYLPASEEATPRDHLEALEVTIHTMARKAIVMRQHLGLHVPGILVALVEADTWRELLAAHTQPPR